MIIPPFANDFMNLEAVETETSEEKADKSAESQQGADGCRDEHRENSGCPEPQRDGPGRQPGGAGIDDQLLACCEGAGHDERAEQCGGQLRR